MMDADNNNNSNNNNNSLKPNYCNSNFIQRFPPPHLSSLNMTALFIALIYTGCNRRNGPDFGRVFLMLNYTEKHQNTYIQS